MTAEVSVNLSRARRWRAVTTVVLFGGGGLTLVFVCLLGLAELTAAQRIGRVTVGVVLVGAGLLALREAVRPTASVHVGSEGLRFHGHADRFTVRWSELVAVALERERRSWGRSRYWSSRLAIVPKPGEFAMDHPEMTAHLAGTRYVYELGRIGRSAKQLAHALTAACPTLFSEVDMR